MKLKITLKTPLNIGSGKEINKGEYVIYNGKAYLIKDNLLFNFLNKENLLEEFNREANKYGKEFSLTEFLKRKRMLDENILSTLSFSSVKIYPSNLRPGRLRTFIKDGLMRYYIPGSSIKGAIRIAILYNFLEKDKVFKERFISKIRKSVNELYKTYLNEKNEKTGGKHIGEIRGYLRKRIKRELNEFKKGLKNKFEENYPSPDIYLLQNFTLNKEEKNPHTDLLRCLRISDSGEIGFEKFFISNVKFYTFGGRKDGKFGYKEGFLRIPLLAEFLEEGNVIEFNIHFDISLLKELKKQNSNNIFLKEIPDTEKEAIEYLIGTVEKFYKKVGSLLREKNIMNFNFPEDSNFRCGFGGGLESVSLFSLLDDDIKRKILEIFFDEIRVERKFYPNHIKLIEKNNSYYPLGWCKIEIKE